MPHVTLPFPPNSVIIAPRRMHMAGGDRTMSVYVAFLPGILGSELTDNSGRQIWPPTFTGLANAFIHHEHFIRRLHPDNPLQPTRVVQERIKVGPFGFCNYAGGFLKWLNNLCGERARVIECPYDWRQSLEVMADTVAHTINASIKDDDGAPLVLIAHSMGGLVARCVLERHPDLASKTSDLVMLGTPNLGSAEAFKHSLGGWEIGPKWLHILSRLGIRRSEVRDLLHAMPSFYSLLPWPGSLPAVLNTRLLPVDIQMDTDWLTSSEAVDLLRDHNPPSLKGNDAPFYEQRMQSGTIKPLVWSVFSNKYNTTATFLQTRPGLDRWDDLMAAPIREGDTAVVQSSARLPGSKEIISAKKHGELFDDDTIRLLIETIVCNPQNARPIEPLPGPDFVFGVQAEESFAVGSQLLNMDLTKTGQQESQPWEVGDIQSVLPDQSERIGLEIFDRTSKGDIYTYKIPVPDVDGIIEIGTKDPDGNWQADRVTVVSRDSLREFSSFLLQVAEGEFRELSSLGDEAAVAHDSLLQLLQELTDKGLWSGEPLQLHDEHMPA